MWPFHRKPKLEIDENTYLGRLLSTRLPYRNNKLLALPNGELERTPDANDFSIAAILDNLILDLAEAGIDASESTKLKCFQAAVEDLNALNKRTAYGLIETAERDDLCELVNAIGAVAGIEVERYGGGEGIASEWRDW